MTLKTLAQNELLAQTGIL